MSADDKDHKKGAQDDGECGQLKQTVSNPDSVQSQDKKQQNLQKQQEGSPSEETREPQLAHDAEKDHLITDLKEENRRLRTRITELQEQISDLNQVQTDNLNQVQTDDLNQVQTEQTDEKWNAECCEGFIFRILKSAAKKMERDLLWYCLNTEDDINKLTTFSGFYMMCLRDVSKASPVDYPIFIGVARNLKLVFMALKWKRDRTGNTIFSRVLGTKRTFPGNRNKIQGLESGLHICMLEMTYPASKCLKESLLGEFNFCLNQKMNNGLRLEIDISGQKENDDVIEHITERGTWEKGIEECKMLEVS